MKGIALGVALSRCAGAAWAADGQQVYDAKCKSCHSIGGVGGPNGQDGRPARRHGSKRDAAWLKAYIACPKSKMPDAKMPKLNLSDDDWLPWSSTC